MAKDFVESPMKPIGSMPAGDKGGPGTYNGDPCADLPRRTPGASGPPEKIFEKEKPGPEMTGY